MSLQVHLAAMGNVHQEGQGGGHSQKAGAEIHARGGWGLNPEKERKGQTHGPDRWTGWEREEAGQVRTGSWITAEGREELGKGTEHFDWSPSNVATTARSGREGC